MCIALGLIVWVSILVFWLWVYARVSRAADDIPKE